MTIRLGSWLYDTDRKTLFNIILGTNGKMKDLIPTIKFKDNEFRLLDKSASVPVGVLNKVKAIEGDRDADFQNVVHGNKR
jgi:hypothetical protein